jgi:putative nucleotidyltransferase with HDIG domain
MRFTFPFHKRYFDKNSTMALQSEPAPNAAQTAGDIIRLFETFGAEDYDGEPVSQTAHMVQCAMLALEAMSDLPVVIGALLHDVGHLLKHEQATEAMGEYGVKDHEGIGAAYLYSKGFSSRVCAIVQEHVAAKRYLVATDAAYKNKLSPASLQTLAWQGGPMSPDEVMLFERHPYFMDILNVRRWDEEAKSRDAVLLPVTYFRKLIVDHLNSSR